MCEYFNFRFTYGDMQQEININLSNIIIDYIKQ